MSRTERFVLCDSGLQIATRSRGSCGRIGRAVFFQTPARWMVIFCVTLVSVVPCAAQCPVRPLADDYTVVYRSPNPRGIFPGSPGIAVCPNGRLVATVGLRGAIEDLPGPRFVRAPWNNLWQGKVFTSDDGGTTWAHRRDFAFLHSRPFVAGKSLYVLGHANDLAVIRSDDWGTTWSEPVLLTEKESWHQSACNVLYANGCVYLVMERYSQKKGKPWAAGIIPVLMRARDDADLTKRESWTFASELPFYEVADDAQLDYFGVPFFKVGRVAPGLSNPPVGWLETNVAQIVDPDHYWYDPRGKTFHLLARAHTAGTGYAAMAKVVENDDGSMTTMLEKTPAGTRFLFVPMPGGQMRFHITYDPETRLYWLLSSQATDSMTRAERLPKDRFNLPNNERHRLQLHFSKNLIDWCFAGLVAVGATPKESRHYAAMAIDGEDLVVLSRSGDGEARDAHDGNIITFHRVKDFRRLVY